MIVPIWIGIPPRVMNVHEMGAKESGSKEHLSTNVDMDDGVDVKWNVLFYPQQETWSCWMPMRVSMMLLWLRFGLE